MTVFTREITEDNQSTSRPEVVRNPRWRTSQYTHNERVNFAVTGWTCSRRMLVNLQVQDRLQCLTATAGRNACSIVGYCGVSGFLFIVRLSIYT